MEYGTYSFKKNLNNFLSEYNKVKILKGNCYYCVKNIRYMLSECSSLISLPDIPKWSTNNVNDMRNMFYECSSLISLPDIPK